LLCSISGSYFNFLYGVQQLALYGREKLGDYFV
jgi:hypothetical protein